MLQHGFLRVAAGVPPLHLGDPARNAQATLELLAQAGREGVQVVVFPELGLTGYTCHDLFHQSVLLCAAREALERLAGESARVFPGLAVVGLPFEVEGRVFNCAAVLSRGRVLGLVPKTYLPNYQEFYEARYFASALTARSRTALLASGAEVPFGTDLLWTSPGHPEVVVGVEICEDLWVPVPPSSLQASAGANVLLNLSASNEVIGKAAYRRELVASQSGRCLAGYVYASSGVRESTTDLVFGGHCLIAENGSLVSESARFQREPSLLIAELDIERLQAERRRTSTFAQSAAQSLGARTFRVSEFALEISTSPGPFRRAIDAHPFVPRGEATLRERCEEIFHTQVAGLARRLEQVGQPPLAIGVSGGLDSTLALLVLCKTLDALGWPRSRVHALTMPGFGTTGRTLANARALMRHLRVEPREIDIRALCLDEWRALGHRPFGIDLAGLTVDSLAERLRSLPPERRADLVFENVQARVRTNLLMNTGFVIGTGDLSELALGWCTYNADHMSMYNVNVSIPKTLVRFLVAWAARHEFEGPVRATLEDIVATVISPELLPTDARGAAVQSTEAVIGPYELHDFFLYHLLRTGASPTRIQALAQHARFDQAYSPERIRHWLGVFLRRFFQSQFKRSALPDGPKVGSISLSPRGDWRMPSDASAAAWLRDLESNAPPA